MSSSHAARLAVRSTINRPSHHLQRTIFPEQTAKLRRIQTRWTDTLGFSAQRIRSLMDQIGDQASEIVGTTPVTAMDAYARGYDAMLPKAKQHALIYLSQVDIRWTSNLHSATESSTRVKWRTGRGRRRRRGAGPTDGTEGVGGARPPTEALACSPATGRREQGGSPARPSRPVASPTLGHGARRVVAAPTAERTAVAVISDTCAGTWACASPTQRRRGSRGSAGRATPTAGPCPSVGATSDLRYRLFRPLSFPVVPAAAMSPLVSRSFMSHYAKALALGAAAGMSMEALFVKGRFYQVMRDANVRAEARELAGLDLYEEYLRAGKSIDAVDPKKQA
ncbi:hypothetical protein CXG81DRAFT_17707 [Caulochytrium protostelioides]|uniref:Uncharacterized protein n=1 Tax=Caulochytrium protostelioides TaxID=1555241 RepID=A0A4P9XB71_9FUNG|nr:hypothetical protein CXG81DRAFT_17707 [Caulochytrium protostelioides]|eukprot:RKP02654.1 hypothetical protein CXG81DRAFT_17707 [Caulochytrium protostelioides]